MESEMSSMAWLFGAYPEASFIMLQHYIIRQDEKLEQAPFLPWYDCLIYRHHQLCSGISNRESPRGAALYSTKWCSTYQDGAGGLLSGWFLLRQSFCLYSVPLELTESFKELQSWVICSSSPPANLYPILQMIEDLGGASFFLTEILMVTLLLNFVVTQRN